MEIVIWSILMLLVGAAVGRIMTLNKTDGFLIIDRSDPDDGPYLFVQLHKDVNELSGRRCVIFRVSNKNITSLK